MNQQFRIGNADGSSTTVKVYLGSSKLDSFTLGIGESVRKNYDVNNGPIQVVSADGKKIIAAMRTIWQEPGRRTSYSELMGLPKEQFSTEYWFPWYNNLAQASMNQQFRIGNADSGGYDGEGVIGGSRVGQLHSGWR